MMKNADTENRNHRSRWTTSELNYVETQYRKVPTSDIAAYLGRTLPAVRSVVQQLGLSKQTHEWTKAEKHILQTHYARGEGITRIMALLPGRTRKTIFTMAQTLGVSSARNWASREQQILRKYYPLLGTTTVRYLPGRTAEAIKIKANELGLRFTGINGHGVTQRMWSDEEWQRLAENLHKPNTELMALFPGRSLFSVKRAKDRLRNKQRGGEKRSDNP
ncbi:hypothetical protein ACGVWS_01835 [Enterobacteriaceae bacterium LUAb1]